MNYCRLTVHLEGRASRCISSLCLKQPSSLSLKGNHVALKCAGKVLFDAQNMWNNLRGGELDQRRGECNFDHCWLSGLGVYA